jgi:site-specific recombinase XerD
MVGRVVPLTTSQQTAATAAAAFLAQPSLARSTRRSYDQTLTRLVRELGSDQPLSTLTVEAITVAVMTAWGGRAPATWNRQVATVRSFLAFCRRRRWLVEDLTVDLERRPEPADRTKAIPLPELERLWRREDVGVREKALWRLLYETAARASEALAINVEDLELENKRVRVPLQGRRHRLAALPERLGPAAAAADRRAHPWAIVLGRPAPGPRPDAGDGGSLSGDRPGPAELPTCRGAVPGGLGRVHVASAAPLGPHPPG